MPLPSFAADLTGFDLLLSVARLGSVGRAAAEHRISQPAASARLRELERRVGLTLLHRTPRGSTLTETGALVADWARSAIDAAEALAAGLAALRATHESRLTVAASQTVAEYLLPAWLVALRAAHPGLAVTLQAANSADVAAAVLTGQVELGFVEGPDLPSGLQAEVVATDRLTVVVAPAHPWARRRRAVTAAELAEAPMVSREAGSGTRRAFEQALGDLVAVAPLLELSSTTAIKHAVAAGSGAAVLSSLAVTAELTAGTLVAVPAAVPLQRRLQAVWRAADQLIGPARDLYAIARRA
ncbi:LysR family transcriptional regulator [Actinoplanes sp. TRM 88003]|uniref:LysR family transcriptional regulator n=1 Tax=Paractinoplanes aksuensis TaxID=2939490 RepID=A0ABT1DZV5_9ACTN|nr:LysR family transcriptional regulator [Actinoplanes aksuensis]MCO8276419.1 LysR family transcriptional regulator [Actinoplanes aksuensis]